MRYLLSQKDHRLTESYLSLMEFRRHQIKSRRLSNHTLANDFDEAVNPTSESHDSIARMNYLCKRKKEKT